MDRVKQVWEYSPVTVAGDVPINWLEDLWYGIGKTSFVNVPNARHVKRGMPTTRRQYDWKGWFEGQNEVLAWGWLPSREISSSHVGQDALNAVHTCGWLGVHDLSISPIPLVNQNSDLCRETDPTQTLRWCYVLEGVDPFQVSQLTWCDSPYLSTSLG